MLATVGDGGLVVAVADSGGILRCKGVVGVDVVVVSGGVVSFY